MLYYLLSYFKTHMSCLNVFHYITVRAACAAVTALVISYLSGPYLINLFKKIQLVEKVNNVHAGLFEKHKSKAGVPTMGGIIMLVAILASVFLWADLSNIYILLVLLSTVWLGVMGFIDDHIKCVQKKGKGMRAKTKLFWQILLSVIVGLVLYLKNPDANFINIPFLKEVSIYVGFAYFLVILFIIVGTSNAVNITDGLDGLAGGCIIIAAFAYAVLAYVAGHAIFSKYLHLVYVDGAGELTVYCCAIIGAGLGFLWYNSCPAQVFMGNTGSLSLGGIIGLIAVMIKQELLLVIVGGVFVIETMSVIIQVFYFKRTGGKRFFLIAPIHHHFEMKGIPESKIVTRFWILAIIFAVIALCSLKIR